MVGQALRFVQKNKEYDGRGVVVGIFDTGVDPAAAGLQTTPDGRPKVIDVVECTGSGDVDMKTKRAAPEESKDGVFIEGLSGRRLKLNPEWRNPSNEYRVGMKNLFDLFPEGKRPRCIAANAASTGFRQDSWPATRSTGQRTLTRNSRA